MATQIGRFEILSEIAKSDRTCVYKANDSTNGQTVALKAVRLEMPAEQAQALIERVQAEADTVNGLNSPNIALLYGAGEIDNVLCAAMEYVQGNSIATMLARREGFSIWDLLDISRQVCQGLDHAHSHGVVHYSFEPAKVMVTWDGTVKILSFGVSMMGMPEGEGSGKPQIPLHYASPEQLRGETVDPRSNFFSWGAILYEMVTDQKAFDGDRETVRRKILEENPVPPVELNRKIHPAVSDLIMKALSKAPDERFQNGQQLVMELEKCKQASAPVAKKSGAPPQALIVPDRVSPRAKSNPAAAKTSAAPPASDSKTTARTPAKTATAASAPPETSEEELPLLDLDSEPAAKNPKPLRATSPCHAKVAAAAAATSSPAVSVRVRPPQANKATPAATKASAPAVEKRQVKMSAAVEQTAPAKKYSVDPMMAEDGPANTRAVSFSELEEMPPLQEVHVAPPEPPAAPETEVPAPPGVFLGKPEPPKAKVPPRVMAKRAVKEISSVPPRLIMYSVAAAIALVLVIVVGLVFHIHSQNVENEGTPAPAASPAATEPSRAQTIPVPAREAPVTPEATSTALEQPTKVEVAPVVKPRSKRHSSAPAQVASLPGQLSVDSTPQGAQVQIDGQTDAAWVTPFAVAGVALGRHTVGITKNGYTGETKTVEVASGSKSFVVLHLAQTSGTVVVHSSPSGAAVYVDGKDTGHVTPMQVSVERGSHTLLVRKQGYLDETTSASLQLGQSFRFAPTLRPLGNPDDIRTVGKFKKIFGGGEGSSEMGTVSIKTQPKGAQIAVNRRMLDKGSPVQFMVGPGNYIIDITASGYKPIHRIVTVEKGVKVALEETMQPE